MNLAQHFHSVSVEGEELDITSLEDFHVDHVDVEQLQLDSELNKLMTTFESLCSIRDSLESLTDEGLEADSLYFPILAMEAERLMPPEGAVESPDENAPPTMTLLNKVKGSAVVVWRKILAQLKKVFLWIMHKALVNATGPKRALKDIKKIQKEIERKHSKDWSFPETRITRLPVSVSKIISELGTEVSYPYAERKEIDRFIDYVHAVTDVIGKLYNSYTSKAFYNSITETSAIAIDAFAHYGTNAKRSVFDDKEYNSKLSKVMAEADKDILSTPVFANTAPHTLEHLSSDVVYVQMGSLYLDLYTFVFMDSPEKLSVEEKARLMSEVGLKKVNASDTDATTSGSILAKAFSKDQAGRLIEINKVLINVLDKISSPPSSVFVSYQSSHDLLTKIEKKGYDPKNDKEFLDLIRCLHNYIRRQTVSANILAGDSFHLLAAGIASLHPHLKL